MPPHFNDSLRALDLRELCGHCGLRLGVHSMTNNCPSINSDGNVNRTYSRTDFTNVKFKPTNRYEQTEVA